jgi:hypothetical protein
MFVGKARGLQYIEEPERCYTWVGSDLTRKHFLLGWKGLPETNTLAYYKNPLITAVKSFEVHAPGVSIMKLFTSVIYECS